MGATVLVTGITRYLGSTLCGRLVSQPGIDRVIGVDASEPDRAALDRMAGAEYVRLDIRNPVIGRVITEAEVTIVIHASASAAPGTAGGRTLVKELNVMGTLQLLAGCQRAPSVHTLIVRSSAAIYGTSPQDAAVFTEHTQPRDNPAAGPARDIADTESYLRSFARRRPDVRVVVPRFAEVIGPTVRTPLTGYLSLNPFVPVPLGQAPRLQLIHEADSVAAMLALLDSDFAGPVNIAADGVVLLNQAIRRLGRTPLPMPMEAISLTGRALRTFAVGGFCPEQVALIGHSRVLDTTRLTTQLGFQPTWTTQGALDDFAATLHPGLPHRVLRHLTGTLAQACAPGRS